MFFTFCHREKLSHWKLLLANNGNSKKKSFNPSCWLIEKKRSKEISTSKRDICIFKLIWTFYFRIFRLISIQKMFSKYLSVKQTKILVNKPKFCRKSTKQNNWFKSLEARALLIMQCEWEPKIPSHYKPTNNRKTRKV